MLPAILNSAMLDSDTSILDSDTLFSSLWFTQKHSHSTLTLTQTNSIRLKLIHSHVTWWWGHLEICHLEFGHLGFSHSSFFSQTHSHLPRLVPNFCTKNFTHSFWINLMMAAILNSAMLDSDTAILDSNTLLSSLRSTQKHSQFILTLTQTNSFWLKLIHSHLTWWLQSSWIWPSWIQPSLFYPLKLTHTCQDWFLLFVKKKTALIHFDSTW